MLARSIDRWIALLKERRLGHRGDDHHIHRNVRGITCGADLVDDPEPAEDFHCSGVAALHFWKPQRLKF